MCVQRRDWDCEGRARRVYGRRDDRTWRKTHGVGIGGEKDVWVFVCVCAMINVGVCQDWGMSVERQV